MTHPNGGTVSLTLITALILAPLTVQAAMLPKCEAPNVARVVVDPTEITLMNCSGPSVLVCPIEGDCHYVQSAVPSCDNSIRHVICLTPDKEREAEDRGR